MDIQDQMNAIRATWSDHRTHFGKIEIRLDKIESRLFKLENKQKEGEQKNEQKEDLSRKEKDTRPVKIFKPSGKSGRLF